MKNTATNILKHLLDFILSFLSKPKSPSRKALIPPIIQKLYDSGFKVNAFGDYDLNIIGIRTVYDEPNKFDDYLYCVY